MKTWVRKSLKVGILSAGFLLIGGAAANAASTTDNFGVLGGNQVQAPIQAPISITGNAISLLGSAQASGSGGSSVSGGAGGPGTPVAAPIPVPISIAGTAIGRLGRASASGSAGAGAGGGASGAGSTGDNFGVGSGNQVPPVINVPVDVCGNAVSLLGTAE